ncbi:MAG TPA: cupredoxin domain-containing protein [Anaeromyxobacter sp.]|nr:cupredoxin domain-containing protein [Anaeromyxobacter sp.]
MIAKHLLLPLAAALAVAAAGTARAGGKSSPIAEGTLKDGVRTIEMAVTADGFEPSKVKVSKGEKVRLVVTRKTDATCATEIVMADQGVNTPLPLNKPVAVEFTPSKSGEIKYACAMGHVGGVVFVK